LARILDIDRCVAKLRVAAGQRESQPAIEQAPHMKTILFACDRNAARSQIAAALFNAIADPAKARTTSAGTNPAAEVHPEVVRALAEQALDGDLRECGKRRAPRARAKLTMAPPLHWRSAWSRTIRETSSASTGAIRIAARAAGSVGSSCGCSAFRS